MKKLMKEKNHVVPDEVLSKEFLSQFKTCLLYTSQSIPNFFKSPVLQIISQFLTDTDEPRNAFQHILYLIHIYIPM